MTGDLQVGSLFAGLLGVAAVHAVMPTHWLSFVLVARAQGWTRGRMLRVVLFSGLGHVTTTAVVGLLAAALSKEFHRHLEHLDTPLPAFVLAGFGLYYVVVGWRRDGHPHCHHDHAEDPIQADRIAAWALFLQMTLSPCETLIPLFFAAGALSWTSLLLMAVGTSSITLVLMAALAFLGFSGYSKLAFPWLEKNERLAVGILLSLLGVFAYFVR